jgi:hypothetical protein
MTSTNYLMTSPDDLRTSFLSRIRATKKNYRLNTDKTMRRKDYTPNNDGRFDILQDNVYAAVKKNATLWLIPPRLIAELDAPRNDGGRATQAGACVERGERRSTRFAGVVETQCIAPLRMGDAGLVFGCYI